jgi:hypothetical protein
MRAHSVLLVTLLLAARAQVSPAVAADLAERIAACTHERDDAQRLACFDRAAAPVTGADETFGVSGSELARKRDQADAKEPAPTRIAANVTAITKRPRGELVFTLDNGQVWAQKEAGGYFPARVGDPVTVIAGTLGSFRLVIAKRSTAVTRID